MQRNRQSERRKSKNEVKLNKGELRITQNETPDWRMKNEGAREEKWQEVISDKNPLFLSSRLRPLRILANLNLTAVEKI